DCVVTEKGKNQNTCQSPGLARGQGEQKKSRIERDKNRNCNEKTEQEFARSAGIFEALLREGGIGPQETANVGREPEPVDTKREHQQDGAAADEPPKCAALSNEANHARGRKRLRRWTGRISYGHGGITAAGCGMSRKK